MTETVTAEGLWSVETITAMEDALDWTAVRMLILLHHLPPPLRQQAVVSIQFNHGRTLLYLTLTT